MIATTFRRIALAQGLLPEAPTRGEPAPDAERPQRPQTAPRPGETERPAEQTA